MKRFNYFLVCFLSLFLWIACNKDVDPGNLENSGDVFASFSVKMGGSSAYTTRTVQQAESALESVHIYMFDENNLLSSNGEISMTGTIGASTLATSLGQKTVYALINGVGNIVLPRVENGVTTVEQFKKMLKQTGVLNDDKIAKLGSFLMFGVAKTIITKEEHASVTLAKANPIEISVNRVSSKVSFIFDASSVGKDGLKGTFSDVKFALNQTHTMLDISRELRVGELTSTTGAINYVETESAADGSYNHLNKWAGLTDDVSYKLASVTAIDASKFANSHYCLENINATPVAGNSTFVVVKLKYTPEDGKISEGGDFSNHATMTTLDGSGNFWTVTFSTASEGSPKYLFATEEDATSVVAIGGVLAGGDVTKHTAGYCYYRLNLRDKSFSKETQMKERYAVLRNVEYRVNIQNITGIGEEDPEELIPVNPETPLEKDEAFVTAIIDILAWTVVDMPEDLN